MQGDRQTIKINKKLLFAPVDLTKVIEKRECCGVRLEYAEYPFLQSETGRYTLFDAYSLSHRFEPFEHRLGAVAFPFSLCCRTDSGERVAYCGLRFGDEQAVVWELCVAGKREGVLPLLAADDNAAAVALASGVCCLASDAAYAEYYSHRRDELPPLDRMIVLDGGTHDAIELFGHRYAVFSTGWGDGRYNCYVGKTASGEITALVVDFGMIEYPRPDGADEYVEIQTRGGAAVYVYDPTKTEEENNIAQWTAALETERDATARLLAYARRGYAYHSARRVDEALADYMTVINACAEITDKHVLVRLLSVYDNAAELFAQKSDHESAINVMEAAIAIGDEFDSSAYVRLIELYGAVKRYDKAIEIAGLMVRRRPDDPVALIKYAEACAAGMDYARAAEAYAALADVFKLYENLFDAALCLIELGEYDRADAAIERYPAKDDSEQYYYCKAYGAFKRRDFLTAFENAERAHALDPEFIPALDLLIDIQSLMQGYHLVALYAEEYKKLRPDNEYGYCVCAEAHLILGNFSESSRNYYYLYKYIRADAKYAALAAITAVKTGDKKRAAALRRKLRKARSPYYQGVTYASDIVSERHKSYTTLSKAIYKLQGDDDFLMLLAVYLTGAGKILPAAYILDILQKKQDPPFELVAQQIRTAVKLRDDDLSRRFLDYYIDKFIGKTATERDRQTLTARFMRE